MPPKKQDQSLSTPYKPCFILPIFVNGPKSHSALSLHKPVNVKKNIDTAKIIQILKDKGLQQYINNGQITQKGRQLACTQLKTVVEQFVSGVNKPADPKKDAKKDAKKQAKKQEPVAQNVIPPIQIQFEKNCSDFFVFLAVPNTPKQLKICLQKDIKIDIIVVVKQKIKPGSRKPNYDLLNNQLDFNDFSKTLQQTKIDPNFNNRTQQNTATIDYKAYSNQMIKIIKQYQSKLTAENPNKNLIILQVPYLNDLSFPQNNDLNFIRSFFQRVCLCTKQLDQYNQWKSTRKLVKMIQPIKQTITKQVQVQDKNDKGKKGGKSAEPVFQTVQEVVQKRYEDFPENIKSDLRSYYAVKKIKQNVVKNQKSGESNYRNILDNCLQCINKSKTKNEKPIQYSHLINKVADRVKKNFQMQPINRMTTQIISNSLRNISYIKNTNMNSSINFNFQSIPINFSFMQLAQRSNVKGQKLMMQFILNQMQKLAKKSSPKIQWKFGDRKYVEKLSKQQLTSILNQQILLDPQVFSGHLQTQGLSLLVMSRTNPPGRVMYHNSIFDWKVLPDFQNWTTSFLHSKQKLEIAQFFDYPFELAGNLAIKAKCMMPADNTVIKDQLYSIGSKKDDILQLYKDNSKFGLTKRKLPNGEDIYAYWHQIQDQYRIRVFKTKIHIVGHRQQSNQAEKNQEIQNIDNIYSSLGVIMRNKGKYLVMMDPNPTIYWQHNKTQKIRKIDTLGSITSYRVDGSIHIYSPNGDVSIFRNGKWTRITDSQYCEGNEVRKVEVTEISQGQNIIKIREDQTISIDDSLGNKKIIFPDGTYIVEYIKQKKRQIKIPNGPVIRIYLPRDYNFNIIGYGSAFAYLGFTNILERSYDGYLFQFIDQDISSHFYTQRYEKNGKLQTQEVRIIAHKDSSIIKISSRESRVLYISPNNNEALTQQTLNQRWLQTFTIPANYGEGVFDVDLNTGIIVNKDSQTNKFIAKVDERSEANIAVSFITEQQDDSVANFPTGFHIKEQNYFLPPPNNRIPARLFTINQDGSGCEYLSKSQLGAMSNYAVTVEHQNQKVVTQYCRQQKASQSYLNITFSKPLNPIVFELPDVLQKIQTKQTLIPNKFDDIRYRVIEEIEWNSNYQNIQKLQKLLKLQAEQKKKRKQNRKIQQKIQQKNVDL